MATGKIYNYFPIESSTTLYAPSTMTEMVPGTTEIQLFETMGNFSQLYIYCYVNNQSSSNRGIIVLPPGMIGITPWMPVGTSSGIASVRCSVGQTNGSNDASKFKVLELVNATKLYVFRVYGVR